jgi:hypothetical protein
MNVFTDSRAEPFFQSAVCFHLCHYEGVHTDHVREAESVAAGIFAKGFTFQLPPVPLSTPQPQFNENPS